MKGVARLTILPFRLCPARQGRALWVKDGLGTPDKKLGHAGV
jgi:hypothetical protein